MSKRYGRNQRRRHREQIAALKEELRLARATCDHRIREWRLRAEVELSNAAQPEERAFQRFMLAGNRIQRILDRMADEVGRQAGEQLKPLFQDAVREQRRQMAPEDIVILRTDPYRFSGGDLPVTEPVRTIYLRLPALGRGYTLDQFDLAPPE